MSIYNKLYEIQQEIKPIKKDEINPYFNSKYFNIDNVIIMLKPILTKKKILLLQPLTSLANGAPAITTILKDMEAPEESSLEVQTPLPQNIDPQKQGAIITYFRRYTLTSLFVLQGEKDTDANDTKEIEPNFKAKPYKAKFPPENEDPFN